MERAEHSLRCNGQPVDLTPKAFATLLQFVENSGRLLDKNTLIATVWQGTAVEDNNLTQIVYMLRKALRDGENGVHYIETVPKHGYRFVAQVEERRLPIEALEPPERESPGSAGVAELSQSPDAEAGAGPAAVTSVPALELTAPADAAPVAVSNAPQSHLPRWMKLGLAALGAAGLLAAGMLLGRLNSLRARLLGRSAGASIQALAVLPLQNLTGDPKQDYFADGMTDELITDLAQLHGIRVISRTSVMQYKGTRKRLPEIARELGVDAVVEGSIARSGDRVRIRAQLVRGATDTHLWAGTFERDLRDVLALQGEIAQAIASQVSLQVTPEEQARLAARSTVNSRAYDLYLKGRAAMEGGTNEALGTAIEYFGEATAQDPKDARAYAGLADSYALTGMDGARSADVMPQARAAALKAIQLDDRLAEGHASLAGVKALYEWDWPGAEREFQRAIELQPQYAPAHHRYAILYLAPLGRTDEAISEMQRTLELDPRSPSASTDLCWMEYFGRQYSTAIDQCREALKLDSAFPQAHLRLTELYLAQGRFDEAFAERQLEQRIISGPAEVLTGAEALYRRSGYRGLLKADLERSLSSEGLGTDVQRATFYAGLGQKDQAFAELARAVTLRDVPLIYLKVDPVWDPLRSDPRFQPLLRQIGVAGPGGNPASH